MNLDLAAETEAYQALLEAVRSAVERDDLEESVLADLREDLGKAWVAMNTAWLERLAEASTTGRDVRAYLRGATSAKIIFGWKQIDPDLFYVNPWPAPLVEMTMDQASDYCRQLAAVDVEPLYVKTDLFAHFD